MPRGDRTGPAGQGPRTGRGLGYCAGYQVAGFEQGYGPGMGWGFRGGMGRGRGFGRGWNYARPEVNQAQSSTLPEANIEVLKSEAQNLTERLNAVLKRIEDQTAK